MAILLYCMTPSRAVAADLCGIGGARLEQLDESGVACWYSEGGIASDTAAGGSTKDDLLAFHRVVHVFFQAGAVVPFRFPTTLADTSRLAAWLQSNAAAVARELERLRGMVQMELHIALAANKNTVAGGGREYLEARRDAQSGLREAAATARQRAGTLAEEWRERETREGLRCYALVARGREREFAAEFGTASASAVGIRVTGPWPAAEFLDPALTKFS